MKIDILKEDYEFLEKLQGKTGKTMAQLFHNIFDIQFLSYMRDKVARETFEDRNELLEDK